MTPSDATPPVNEVVLSVAIQSQDALVGPRIPEILGPLYSHDMSVTSVPPYEMPVEARNYADSAGLSVPRLIFSPDVPETRFWLISRDQVFVIQVQKNYLALNWRRRNQEYVRYDALRERFALLLKTVAKNLATQSHHLVIQRAELTYINLIEPSTLWSRHSDVQNVIRLSFADEQDYEQLALSYSKSLILSGEWLGRTHVALQPTLFAPTSAPRLSLTITSRSDSLSGDTSVAAFDFLDAAHSASNAIFVNLLTEKAKAHWKVEE